MKNHTAYQNIIEHLSQDQVLSKILHLDIQIPKDETSLFQALLKAVISQQLSLKAAATIHERFLNLFSNRIPTQEAVLSCTAETLRSIGLSHQKSTYVKNIAQFFIENNLEQLDCSKYSNQELIDLLIQIKGVGIWTVEMILIFNLGRQDVFPMGDLGIKNAMVELYDLTSEGKPLLSEIEKIAAQWKPYRTYASLFLWRSLSET